MKKSKKILCKLFTLCILVTTTLFPNSAFAEVNKEYVENANIKMTIQSKSGWGGVIGTGWCYKTWTGNEIKPVVKIFDGNKELVEGQDYKLKYGNNIDMGYCKIYLSNNGAYKYINLWAEALCQDVFHCPADCIDGDEVYSNNELLRGPLFVIRPQGTTLNKATPQKKAAKITWKRQAKKMSVKRITGYQIQLSTNSKFKSGTNRTITVKGYKNTSKTVKKLKANKKYYVRIRTYYQCKDGFKAYSVWSKAKAVKTK